MRAHHQGTTGQNDDDDLEINDADDDYDDDYDDDDDIVLQLLGNCGPILMSH